MTYRGQNWVAKLELPNQWSSQNLTFLPLPTNHLIPILAACKTHITPFQKGDAVVSLLHRTFGLLVLYLWSMILTHIESFCSPYLKIQELSKERFKFLILGMSKVKNPHLILLCHQLPVSYVVFMRIRFIWELAGTPVLRTGQQARIIAHKIIIHGTKRSLTLVTDGFIWALHRIMLA